METLNLPCIICRFSFKIFPWYLHFLKTISQLKPRYQIDFDVPDDRLMAVLDLCWVFTNLVNLWYIHNNDVYNLSNNKIIMGSKKDMILVYYGILMTWIYKLFYYFVLIGNWLNHFFFIFVGFFIIQCFFLIFSIIHLFVYCNCFLFILLLFWKFFMYLCIETLIFSWLLFD